jgi:hypothetical protein
MCPASQSGPRWSPTRRSGRTLNEAPALVKPFVDPLLNGTATGAETPNRANGRGRELRAQGDVDHVRKVRVGPRTRSTCTIAGSRPPDSVCGHHQAPPSSANSAVRRHGFW